MKQKKSRKQAAFKYQLMLVATLIILHGIGAVVVTILGERIVNFSLNFESSKEGVSQE